MKLTKHVRFRKENEYILLCKVDTLQYFRIDNKFLNFLEQLKLDYNTINFNGLDKKEVDLFMEDLKEMDVLENE